MTEQKQKFTVKIFGEMYALKGDADAERVKQVAALVDARMKILARADSRLSSVKIAVLAALNIADDFLRLEQDYQQLMQMLKEEK
jgi:cell division protein ZapA